MKELNWKKDPEVEAEPREQGGASERADSKEEGGQWKEAGLREKGGAKRRGEESEPAEVGTLVLVRAVVHLSVGQWQRRGRGQAWGRDCVGVDRKGRVEVGRCPGGQRSEHGAELVRGAFLERGGGGGGSFR